jgi:hypothetical protein
MIEVELDPAEELLPIPKLPSWSQMLDHLTGTVPVQPPISQRKSRKITFETEEDKDFAG